MKRLYIAESLVDGQLLLDLLIDAGIDAELFNQNASGGLGELPVTYPEIWIRNPADELKAEQVIDRAYQSAHSTALQACDRCGESSPASFEICWQCHTPLTPFQD